jgi:pyridoxamine 5'-phosphate oxidase
MSTLSELRREYGRHGLTEVDAAADPIIQLFAWLEAAIAAGVPDAHAMVLATVGADGQPSARVVLLRGLDAQGLTFFTNYQSRKGRDLAKNPRAAVTFFWPEVERQVRAEGTVEKVSDAESDEYFASRPRDSQLSAWVSDQSESISGGRPELEKKLAELTIRFADGPVPRPPHWGGYRLRPSSIEFWQGRPGRLHDRLLYTSTGDSWRIVRLAP